MMIQTLPARWNVEDVRDFDESESDILLLETPTLNSIAQIIADAQLGEGRSPMSKNQAGEFIRRVLSKLNLDHAELTEDMTATFQNFLQQFRLKEANLLIECTNRRNCPLFHCDNLHVRMVKTYFGPTTEYIHDAAPEVICTAPIGAMVFLKGRRHRNHADSVHHRSPEIPAGSKRLCLIIDF